MINTEEFSTGRSCYSHFILVSLNYSVFITHERVWHYTVLAHFLEFTTNSTRFLPTTEASWNLNAVVAYARASENFISSGHSLGKWKKITSSWNGIACSLREEDFYGFAVSINFIDVVVSYAWHSGSSLGSNTWLWEEILSKIRRNWCSPKPVKDDRRTRIETTAWCRSQELSTMVSQRVRIIYTISQLEGRFPSITAAESGSVRVLLSEVKICSVSWFLPLLLIPYLCVSLRTITRVLRTVANSDSCISDRHPA